MLQALSRLGLQYLPVMSLSGAFTGVLQAETGRYTATSSTLDI